MTINLETIQRRRLGKVGLPLRKQRLSLKLQVDRKKRIEDERHLVWWNRRERLRSIKRHQISRIKNLPLKSYLVLRLRWTFR